MSARYAVGIDLGTTHCALAYLPLDADAPVAEPLLLPQVVSPGAVEARPLLPSFLYLPHPDELAPGALTLPWAHEPTEAVGEVARALGAKSPQRVIASAKSWLCHGAVDRRAPILPVEAPEELTRRSPFEVTVRYLRHLREAFDAAFPDAPLRDQRLTLTVPAAFDPAARELTVEAAREAGLGHAVLLEEPQAALYGWVMQRAEAFRDELEVGDLILVIDVGGGTTDLSLIAAREEEGQLALERVAVGEHILLGGDNMDLALAYRLAAQLEAEGRRLDAAARVALTHAARGAKERLLAHLDEAEAPVVLPGRGARLIGGSLRTSLTRAVLDEVLLEGFLPRVEASARPASRARAGLVSLGLPYAQDAAITRHLAVFLSRHAEAVGHEGFARPTALLFNGGVFNAAPLEARVCEVLGGWLAAAGAPAPRVLEGAQLELAVARGAAYYGYVRAGHGLRIRGGSPMAYYVGVESSAPAVPGLPPQQSALCVSPLGLEEGTLAPSSALALGLVVGEPVRFHFYGSTVRRDDAPGALLELPMDDALTPLEDIELSLPAEGRAPGEVVTVRLAAGITELGTLELTALEVDGEGRWEVSLDTRGRAG